ncbi:MAG: uracil-DNA glycosylase [Alphaproteobacteria bacterium]|nr:uracil-DNA glycosylase [Alphaproteobacteria bacterium]
MTSSLSSPIQLDELSSAEMLEMLKFQVELGADECLWDDPGTESPPATALSEQNTPLNTPQNISAAQPPLSQPPLSQTSPSIAERMNASPRSSTGAAVSGVAPDWSACTTTDELKAKAEQWSGSDLKKTASNIVFSDGPAGAEIMMIGECPGADDDRQGKPFAGAAGQLLGRMLASIGLDRQQVYLTSMVLWRPPGNRTPTPEEVQQFQPVLARHIQLAQPKLLVSLGGMPMKSLMGGTEGILKLRGQWRDYDSGDGTTIPMLATLNPEHLLNTPGQKALAWKDLRLIHRKRVELGLVP